MNAQAQKALIDLREGNARFVAGALINPRRTPERRQEVAPKQHPIAAILSCSDSRVPPEILFDQGLGDLFVVRVAGNVLNDENIGSIEYAVEHLRVPLVVVLGHTRCGAVKAAVVGGLFPGCIASLVAALAPAVDEAKRCAGGAGDDLAEVVTRVNVERGVARLKGQEPILSGLVRKKELAVVGALYDLGTGVVSFLD